MEELTLTSKDRQDARMALLRYYSSVCVAHGVYLVALAVGFFGLVEATPLIVEFVAGVDFLFFTSELAGGILASLMLSIFIVLIIYILGRTFFWGYLTTVILKVKPKEESEVEIESEGTTATFVQRLHVACIDYMKEKHKWLAIVYKLRISTLLLIWFYLFVAFTIVSLVLLYIL